MKPDICIYHGPGCMDGLVAAWSIWKRWPDIQFVPAQYGQEPPDVADKSVLIVDFSYKRDVLLRMAERAKYIVVLDHHKTAQADLADFIDPALKFPDGWIPRAAGHQIAALFEMDKSGARLAWEYGHPGNYVPMMVQNVEDRDLWRFQMPWTREVHAYLTSCDLDFPTIDGIAAQIDDRDLFKPIVIAGASILRQHNKNVDAMLAATLRRGMIAGYDVPMANLPPVFASDAGNVMAKGEAFAAVWYEKRDGTLSFSLRSAADGVDVSEVAAKYGGGGHVHAAGFAVPKGWKGE